MSDEAAAQEVRFDTPPVLKAWAIARFCLSSGALVGGLVYAVALPFASEIPVLLGFALASGVGAFVGLFASPLMVWALLTRDLRAVRPLLLWSVSGVAVLAALFLRGEDALRVAGIAGGAFVAGGLLAHFLLTRVWEVPGLCRFCGYDLRGSLEFGRCPECGRPFPQAAPQLTPFVSPPVEKTARRLRRALVRYPWVPVLPIILFGACLRLGQDYRRSARTASVEHAIRAAFLAGRSFDLAAAAPFAWDTAYVFRPYSSPAQIEGVLGFRWPDVSRTGIEMNDGSILIVFVRNKRVVAWSLLNLPTTDVDNALCARPLKRVEAILSVKEVAGRLILQPP